MEVVKENNILFTGGSGLLGTTLRKLFSTSLFPTHQEFDVNNKPQCWNYILHNLVSLDGEKLLVHAAAIKSPPKIDKNPMPAMETNIVGTANLVILCAAYNIKLIYISSDYVLSGNKGNYSEEDEVGPVNKYGWSKLGGECVVRMYDNSLIVRISFFPDVFPYEGAFSDQFISRLPVSSAAQILQKIIYSDMKGIIHLGGESKSTYDFALSTSRGKEIKKISIKDVDSMVPQNTTMNINKLEKFLGHTINI